MRLGGPVFLKEHDPGQWVAELKRQGFSAAYSPAKHDWNDARIVSYAEAASAAGIVIAESGVWNNPLHPDATKRKAAIAQCQQVLAVADQIGARCCVNITGSRGEDWAGPDPLNLTPETFDLIVETTRATIDAVKPRRTCYALETMPWMYPDSPDSYLALLKAIDRKQLGVHLDPVNLVSSPQRFFANGALIRECFAKLGPHIKSCHGKDITLGNKLTVHLDEARPGLGGLDYRTFLRELDKLDADTPLMLEHLPNEEEYALAAKHVRAVATEIGVNIR